MFPIHQCCCRIAIALLAVCTAASGDAWRAFQPVPDDALAIAMVPHPRHFNDAIGQVMNGMDRSTAIFGSRPIDQIKSMLRITVAVNELRPAAVALVPRGEEASTLLPVWIIPVTDADDFLRSNFQRMDDAPANGEPIDRIRHPRFGELYARVVGHHVAIARDRRALEGWQATGVVADRLQDRLDHAGRGVLNAGDIALWIRNGADPRWQSFQEQVLNRVQERWPASRPLLRAFTTLPTAHAADTIITIDLDPLGLFVRSWSRTTGEIDPALSEPPRESRHLRALSRKPYLFAVAMDHRGLAICRTIAEHLEWERPARSLRSLSDVQQLDFVAYSDSPSGVLGRAMVRLEHAEPNAAETINSALRVWLASEDDALWRNAATSNGAASARAYEIRPIPTQHNAQGMMPAMLFGSAGWQGYVIAQEERAALTFSRARPMREAALDALMPADDALAADPILRSMMNWFPDEPAMVGFLNAGSMMRQLKPLMQPMLARMGLRPPDVPAGLPPAALAVRADAKTIEAIVIVPAGILAIGYDLVGEQIIRQRFLTPAEPRDDERAAEQ